MSSAAPVEAILLSVPTIDSSSETVIRSPSIDVSLVNTDPTDTNGSVLSKKNNSLNNSSFKGSESTSDYPGLLGQESIPKPFYF